MDILDLALKYNDYDWAKELNTIDDSMSENNADNSASFEPAITLFSENAVALEKIITQYAIKEKNGLRSFNINSDFDRNEADLVLVENPPYMLGDTVKYYTPSQIELTQMRATVNGYVMGYRDAYKELNKFYDEMFRDIEDNDKALTVEKTKRSRKSSGKEKTNIRMGPETPSGGSKY